MKICFLIRALDYGGAERQLVLLAKGLHRRGHEIVVALFYAGGPLEKELREAGIRIQPLCKRGRWDLLGFLFRLITFLRQERPDILHSYMSGANLMAVAVRPLVPTIKIAWGVRSSMMDFSQYDRLSGLDFKLSCWLGRFADIIIANSQAGRDAHVASGYPAAKTTTIPNGIDTECFRPDPEARRRFRSEWNVKDHETLIGIVGRLDPMKDHATFLKAAAALAQERSHVKFVCIGDGPAHFRASLHELTKTLGMTDQVIWVGSRSDVSSLYSALDLLVSSSAFGEGFSNVLGEAMACGVPCVATNVGDSVRLVGDTGEVVPPHDPAAMMRAIERILDRRPYTSDHIRQRIVQRMSVETLVQDTESVLLTLSRQPPETSASTSASASLFPH